MRGAAAAGVILILSAIGISAASAAGSGTPAKKSAPAHSSALAAPHPQSPANGVSVESMPVLTWSAVRGAATYDYQVAADRRFTSIVLGSGAGKGTSAVNVTAAALDQAVPDGTYYWRVRAIDAKDSPGPWSGARRIVKKWSDAPKILGPNGSSVNWPASPLVLQWSAVPYATQYLVTIATDPALSNAVLGSPTSPLTTMGTAYALPTSLAPGQYYWSVTPEDAEGDRGTPSAVASFTWAWPSDTTTQVTNTNPNPQVFDPQFSWNPVPGAAQYQVEVNGAQDFPTGSKLCCTNVVTGSSFSPTQNLGNATYFWRVRAIDAHGDAGDWNVGTPFTKAFDSTPPTISNLTMSDASGHPLPGAPVSTDTPIVTWSPVPGAARYEVQDTVYVTGYGCNWSGASTDETATTAWTPLGPASVRVGPSAWPGPQTDGALTVGGEYCVRVLARTDDDQNGNQVVSDWTQVGGTGNPAFTLLAPPPPGSPGPGGLVTPANAYILPAAGSNAPLTPLFTWNRVAGAQGYFVVIARDAGFTQVVDVGFTNIPAYAPRLANQEPLADETSAYYWAVIPSEGADGTGVFSNPPGQDSPQTFTKSSIPPSLAAPAAGAIVRGQPTFTWTPAENARNYTLQVSEDPSFGSPIDNVTTDSTSFTSSSTYPADATLYWRVRANDWVGQGLNWSATSTFTRTLPIPVPAAGNPTSGDMIPVLSWSAVQGAIAYDVNVEEPNGQTAEATVDSSSFTPTQLYGVGVWRWQVRAEFPNATGGTVAGGYSPLQTYVRKLGPPAHVHGTKLGTRIVLTWQPDPAAKQYEVDVSATDGFSATVTSDRIDGTQWAPNINLASTPDQGRLYWRVAAIDMGGNTGTFATGSFSPPHPAAKRCASSKAKGHAAPKACAKPKAKTKTK